MPGSSPGGRKEAIEMLLTLDGIDSILDVGPGWGIWGEMLRPWFPEAWLSAVEIFKPYVDRYDLKKKYDYVYLEDVRDMSTRFAESGYRRGFDLVIFGDVLEHMPKPDAVGVVEALLRRYALISIPIGECPQEGTEENPYEEHVATWSTEEVLMTFPVIRHFTQIDPPPLYGRGVFLLEKRA